MGRATETTASSPLLLPKPPSRADDGNVLARSCYRALDAMTWHRVGKLKRRVRRTRVLLLPCTRTTTTRSTACHEPTRAHCMNCRRLALEAAVVLRRRPAAFVAPGPHQQQVTRLFTLARSRSVLEMASSAGLRHRTATPTQTRTHSSHTHSHSHSHGDEETQALLSALSGSSDPGSRITLVGLGANVGLTITKGVAGWLMASAALLADAAHSGSDLLADIVTLTTYRMSRRPVSASHPYGYGSEFSSERACLSTRAETTPFPRHAEYESLGSLVVSFLLIGTALGIGEWHCRSRNRRVSR